MKMSFKKRKRFKKNYNLIMEANHHDVLGIYSSE